MAELGDANQAVLLRGSVLDSRCRGLAGATVDVWYAGGRDNTGGHITLIQVDYGVELETKVHPKVRNHGEGPY